MPTNKNFSYKNEFYNTSNSSTTNTLYPERDIPTPQKLTSGSSPTNQTYIYKNETHNTTNRIDGHPNGPPLNAPNYPNEPGTNQTYIYKREVNETKNNIYGPPGSALPPRSRSPQQSPPVNSTYVYERNETNTNRNVHHPPGGIPVYPNNANLPPQPGPKQTYLYKKETSNTTNTTYAPPDGGDYPPVTNARYPPVNQSPPYGSPNEPNTTAYKYTTHTTTTNVHNRPEREPLLAPFPTHLEPAQVDGQPPKNLGQLLATFDDVSLLFHLLLYLF